MTYYPREFHFEVERIRDTAERMDRHLEESGDLQRTAFEAMEGNYREQLQLAGDLVASEEYIADHIADVSYELRDIGDKLDRITEIQEAGFKAVSRSIEQLGPLFHWGFDHVICQLELERTELQKIVETLQRPLDTQAKELRERGFTAMRHGWHDEALQDLFASEQKNYCDFTVLRAIATMLLEHKQDWAGAHSYYEKAAKYAKPYSLSDAAENHLGASAASRLLNNALDAYTHTGEALHLNPDSLVARYEHAVNCICLRQSSRIPTGQASGSLADEAVNELRKVLWSNERYSVRLVGDPYFAPIDERRVGLLKSLKDKLAREERELLKCIDHDLVALAAYCTPRHYETFGSKVRCRRSRLQTLFNRGGILDLVELRESAPALEQEIKNVRATAANLFDLRDIADSWIRKIEKAASVVLNHPAQRRFPLTSDDLFEWRHLLPLREREDFSNLEEVCRRVQEDLPKIERMRKEMEELSEREAEVNRCLSQIAESAKMARENCGAERFAILGSALLREQGALETLWNSEEWVDTSTVLKRCSDLKRKLDSTPALVRRTDELMDKLTHARQSAQRLVPSGSSSSLSSLLAEVGELDRAYRENTLPGYTDLSERAPDLMRRIYEWAEQRLLAVRDEVERILKRAKEADAQERARLYNEAKQKEMRAFEVEAIDGVGCLFWILTVMLWLGLAGLLAPVFGIGASLLISLATSWLVWQAIKSFTKEDAEYARECAESYRSREIPAIGSALTEMQRLIDQCRRQEPIDLPELARRYLA